MSERDIHAEMLSELKKDRLSGAILIDIHLKGGNNIYYSNCGYDLEFNGNTYVGAGNLLGVSTTEENFEIQNYAINVSLSGINSTHMFMSLNKTEYQNRIMKIWLAAIDTSNMTVIPNPILIFSGRMDVPTITDHQEESKIEMSVQSRLVDWESPRKFRFNHEDQINNFDETDRGFEHVIGLLDKQITFGGTYRVPGRPAAERPTHLKER